MFNHSFWGSYYSAAYWHPGLEADAEPTELRMLCASMTVTPRLSGSPSISPAVDASGVSVDPALTGTVTIERC